MAEIINLDMNPNDLGWMKYCDRVEWKDIEPIPQNDGSHPITEIAYTDVFSDIFDYFRAVLHKNELSERAFQLTKDAATLNPANYTVWYFRRVLVKALNKNLKEELDYIAQVIEEHPKNYQVWHHRQVIVQWSGDASQEKKFTEYILELDPKNYHAWQYRQYILQEFSLWEGEIDFVNILIEDDVRNNSAWNQRYVVLSKTGQIRNEDVIADEISYTLKNIKMVPQNESSWNYLRGLLQDRDLSSYPQVADFCEELQAGGCRSPHLLCFIVDYLTEQGDTFRAIQICDELAKEHDTLRKEYWNFLARNIAEKHSLNKNTKENS